MPLANTVASDPRSPAQTPYVRSRTDSRYPVLKRELVPFEPTRASPTYLKILGYFQTHLTATSSEAMRSLNLSRATVQRYVKLIRSDWNKPEPFLLDPEAIEMRLRNLERAVSAVSPTA